MTSFFHKKIFFCRLLSCRHCKSATILHCDLEGKVTKQKSQKRLSMSQKWCNISEQNTNGVMAQLVARLNGIQKVRGSNPLGSTTKIPYILYGIFCLFPRWLREFRKIRATAMPCEPLRADNKRRETQARSICGHRVQLHSQQIRHEVSAKGAVQCTICWA